MVGVGAAVVVGGGAAAAASGKLPVDLPWEQGIDVSKFELDENGLLPKEAYDNKKNHKAVEAYMNALDDIKNTYNTEYAYVYIVDLDQNGVVELLVTGVEDEADDSHIFSNYYMNYEAEDQPIKLENPFDSDLVTRWTAYAALLPEENELILTYGDSQEVEGLSMKISDQTLTETGTFGWAENNPDEQRFTTDQLRQAEDVFKRADYLEKNWDDISQEDMLYPSNIVGLTRRDMDGMMFIGDEDMEIVRPYIPAVDTEFAMEGDDDGTLDTTLLSYADYRSDKNREAVRAYADTLRNDSRFTEVKSLHIVDIDQDGVVEFVVHSKVEDEMYAPYYSDWVVSFLSYDGKVSVEEIYSTIDRFAPPEIGVIPKEKKLALISPEDESLVLYEYSFDGTKMLEGESYFFDGQFDQDPSIYNYYNEAGEYITEEEDSSKKKNERAENELNKIILPVFALGDYVLENKSEYNTTLDHMGSDMDTWNIYPSLGYATGSVAVEAVRKDGYWSSEW